MEATEAIGVMRFSSDEQRRAVMARLKGKRGPIPGVPGGWDAANQRSYERLYPRRVQSTRNLRVGDIVKARRTERTVRTAWGKPLGRIVEIRAGPSGPFMLSVDPANRTYTLRGMGREETIAHIEGDGWHLFPVQDIEKVRGMGKRRKA